MTVSRDISVLDIRPLRFGATSGTVDPDVFINLQNVPGVNSAIFFPNFPLEKPDSDPAEQSHYAASDIDWAGLLSKVDSYWTAVVQPNYNPAESFAKGMANPVVVVYFYAFRLHKTSPNVLLKYLEGSTW